MYNEVIEIVKSWSVVWQFSFFFVAMLAALMATTLVVYTIGKFFTKTLPVLLRGWPTHGVKTQYLDDDNG